jgi:hypothetical protein
MSGQTAWVYGLVELNICQDVTETSSLNAMKASWCCMAHCVINWQVIVLKDLSLPLDKVLLTDTNFVMYIKARSEKVRLSWYCEEGNKTQLFTVLLKVNVLGKCV